MAAAFRFDEKVSIERKSAGRDPDYGTAIETWELVAERIWANVQDILPSRSAELAANGVRVAKQHTRLRIRTNPAITADMRVILHGKGNRVMQIVGGPALMDDRMNVEFMLEGYTA